MAGLTEKMGGKSESEKPIGDPPLVALAPVVQKVDNAIHRIKSSG